MSRPPQKDWVWQLMCLIWSKFLFIVFFITSQRVVQLTSLFEPMSVPDPLQQAASASVSWAEAEEEDFAYVTNVKAFDRQPSKAKSVAWSVVEEITDEMADDVLHADKTRHYVSVSSRW